MVFAQAAASARSSRGGAAWARLIRIAAASLALGLMLGAAAHYRAEVQAPFAQLRLGPLHAKEIAVVLVSVAAAAIYPLLLFASGGITLAEIRRNLRRRPVGPQS